VKAIISTIERFTILMYDRTSYQVNETQSNYSPRKEETLTTFHQHVLHCWSTLNVQLTRGVAVGRPQSCFFQCETFHLPKVGGGMEKEKAGNLHGQPCHKPHKPAENC